MSEEQEEKLAAVKAELASKKRSLEDSLQRPWVSDFDNKKQRVSDVDNSQGDVMDSLQQELETMMDERVAMSAAPLAPHGTAPVRDRSNPWGFPWLEGATLAEAPRSSAPPSSSSPP